MVTAGVLTTNKGGIGMNEDMCQDAIIRLCTLLVLYISKKNQFPLFFWGEK